MKKHRIIIAGSRTCSEQVYGLGRQLADLLADYHPDDIEIVSGGAKGADRLGENFAAAFNLPVKRFLPDYEKHGKHAPLIRNTKMAAYATELIALWDSKSRGTAHMIQAAKKMGLPIRIIEIK